MFTFTTAAIAPFQMIGFSKYQKSALIVIVFRLGISLFHLTKLIDYAFKIQTFI